MSAICLFNGLFEGVLKEVVSTAGVVIAFYPATKYYPLVLKPLSDLVSHAAAMNIIGFFLLFGVVVISIVLLGNIACKIFWNIAFTRLTDYCLGALVGFAKGIMLVSVILVVLTAFLSKGSPLLRESEFSPHVAVISDKMALFAWEKVKRRYFTKRIVLENSWETQGLITNKPRS